MYLYYSDYYWDFGKPRGKNSGEVQRNHKEIRYRIVQDPYFRRYTIEKYSPDTRPELVYDSALLDFRKVKKMEQTGWKKEILEENADTIFCLIRDQDDRIILEESYTFREGLCTGCEIFYPSGGLLSTQVIHYKALGDEDNVVILYDRLLRPVVKKIYAAHETTGEFTDLLHECWNFAGLPPHMEKHTILSNALK